MKTTIRRRLASVLVIAGVATLGAVQFGASPAASTGGPPFATQIYVPNFTGVASPSGQHWTVGYEPFSTTVRPLGRVDVMGEVGYCYAPYFPPGQGCDVSTTHVSLMFTTPSGARLWIAGSGPRTEPVPWTVTGGTERFARTTGSGLFRYEVDWTRHVLALWFDGSLRFS